MSLPVGRALERADLLREEFRVHKDGNIEAYFMPSDGLNPAATLLLAGITPGWTQMELAYREVRCSIAAGMSAADARMSARYVAGFGGSMRKNLVSMLDGIGVAEVLDVRSTERLFAPDRAHVHSTSVFRHPVFIRGKNYTGHGGHLERSAFGQACIRDLFVSELDALPEALVVPI